MLYYITSSVRKEVRILTDDQRKKKNQSMDYEDEQEGVKGGEAATRKTNIKQENESEKKDIDEFDEW